MRTSKEESIPAWKCEKCDGSNNNLPVTIVGTCLHLKCKHCDHLQNISLLDSEISIAFKYFRYIRCDEFVDAREIMKTLYLKVMERI